MGTDRERCWDPWRLLRNLRQTLWILQTSTSVAGGGGEERDSERAALFGPPVVFPDGARRSVVQEPESSGPSPFHSQNWSHLGLEMKTKLGRGDKRGQTMLEGFKEYTIRK